MKCRFRNSGIDFGYYKLSGAIDSKHNLILNFLSNPLNDGIHDFSLTKRAFPQNISIT